MDLIGVERRLQGGGQLAGELREGARGDRGLGDAVQRGLGDGLALA
jgi:hypothetical protein